jgi:hypothetical protein
VNFRLRHLAFSVFPNPVKDRITVRLADGHQAAALVIYDALGRKSFTTRITSSNSVADLHDLPPGFYFLQLYAEKQLIYSEKILKE